MLLFGLFEDGACSFSLAMPVRRTGMDKIKEAITRRGVYKLCRWQTRDGDPVKLTLFPPHAQGPTTNSAYFSIVVPTPVNFVRCAQPTMRRTSSESLVPVDSLLPATEIASMSGTEQTVFHQAIVGAFCGADRDAEPANVFPWPRKHVTYERQRRKRTMCSTTQSGPAEQSESRNSQQKFAPAACDCCALASLYWKSNPLRRPQLS